MALDFFKALDADDIFISYSRADGEAYLTGIDAALSGKGFSCFTDKRGTDAGPNLPESLLQRIRLCKTFVLVGSPGAIREPKHITQEVSEFAAVKGTARVIGISFDRAFESTAWSDAPWNEYVEGKSIEHEDLKALTTGEPSGTIIDNITKASDYMKSKDRLRQYRDRALMVFLGLVGAGLIALIVAIYGFWQAGSARNDANSARNQAVVDIAKARDDVRKAAAQAALDIQTAKSDAQQQIDKIQGEAQDEIEQAEIQTRAADRQRAKAEVARNAAQSQADIQKTIADSRSLANRSQMILRQHPDQLPRSISMAMEALKKYPTVEADAVLRDGLRLSPRLLRSEKYENSIAATALSPDGKYFGTLTTDDKLRVYASDSRTVFREVDCKGYEVALSNNATHAAVRSGNEIRVFDFENNTSNTIKLEENLSVNKLSFSPRGRYLALLLGDKLEPNSRRAELLEVSSGRLVKSLGEGNDTFVDIAFGPTGDLVVAVPGTFLEGPRAGRLLVWPLSATLREREMDQELVNEDFSNLIEADLNEEIHSIAVGADGLLVATDKAVWRRTGLRRYEPVARIPVADIEEHRANYRVESMAFSPDSSRLIVARLIDGKRLLETWDATAHGEATMFFHPAPILKVTFKPGTHRVGLLTAAPGEMLFGPNDLHLRFFNAGDRHWEAPADSMEKDERVIGVGADLDFVVTTGKESVNVHNIWKSTRVSLPYGVDELKRPDAAVVSSNAQFLALLNQEKPKDRDAKQAEDENQEDDDNKEVNATVSIYAFNGSSYKRLRQITFPGYIAQLALTPDGRSLVVRSRTLFKEYLVRVWSVADGRDATISALQKLDQVNWFALSPDGRFLAVLDASHTNEKYLTRILRLGDATEIASFTHEKPPGNYFFSSHGRYLLSVGSDKVTRLVDLSNGRFQILPEGMRVISAEFSPDERYLGVGDDVGLLRVYRTDDLTNVNRIQHDDMVSAIAFSDDGTYVATATSWFKPFNLKTMKVSLRLSDLFDTLSHGADKSEGTENIKGNATADYCVRVWFLRHGDLLAEAAARLEALPAYAR